MPTYNPALFALITALSLLLTNPVHADNNYTITGDGWMIETPSLVGAPDDIACAGFVGTSPWIAVPAGIFDANVVDGENSALCNQNVIITDPGTGAVMGNGTVTDRCEGCGESGLNVSSVVYDKLAVEGAGNVTGLTWWVTYYTE